MFTNPFFKLIRCQRIIRPFCKENPVNEVIMNVLQIKEKKNFPLFPRHFTCIQSNILFKSFYFGYIEEILNIFCFLSISLREKCSNTEFFWSVFFRIRTEYGPEKTPYLATFHAVYLIFICVFCSVLSRLMFPIKLVWFVFASCTLNLYRFQIYK